MRIYDGRLGRFLSVDPITSKYPMLTPYQFASNSPISGVDLDGLEFYYAADGSFLGQGKNPDNKEVRLGKTLGEKADGRAIFTAVDLDGNTQKQWTIIHNNIDDFKILAGVLYAESDGKSNQAINEVAGIVSVLKNRANYENTTVNDQATVAKGVFGAKETEANKINKEKGPIAVAKSKAVFAGVVKGLVSKQDFSNGAFYWDGKDFNGKNKIHGGYDQRYKPGFQFTDKAHDLFSQGDNLKFGKTKYGGWNYKYESTGAEGKTTFSKLTFEWRDAQYSGDKKAKQVGTGHE